MTSPSVEPLHYRLDIPGQNDSDPIIVLEDVLASCSNSTDVVGNTQIGMAKRGGPLLESVLIEQNSGDLVS